MTIYFISGGTIFSLFPVGRYFRHDDVVVSVMSDVHGVVLNLHSLGGGHGITFFK